MVTSTNGLDWLRRESGAVTTLNAVGYGQCTVVAVGVAGTILQSDQLPGTPLSLGPVKREVNGLISLRVNGSTGDLWELQASTNLINWAPVITWISTNSVDTYIDRESATLAHRFYRGWSW